MRALPDGLIEVHSHFQFPVLHFSFPVRPQLCVVFPISRFRSRSVFPVSCLFSVVRRVSCLPFAVCRASFAFRFYELLAVVVGGLDPRPSPSNGHLLNHAQ